MRDLFFIRKSAHDLLKEQNLLLHRILENQNTVLAAAPVQEVPEGYSAVFQVKPGEVEDEEMVFIPKIVKATKSTMSKVDTSSTSWDAAGVDKLKKAKEAAKKK